MTTRKNEVCVLSEGKYPGEGRIVMWSDEEARRRYDALVSTIAPNDIQRYTAFLLDEGYELFATHVIHDRLQYVFRKVIG